MPASLMSENFLLVLIGFIILVANLIMDIMQVRKGQSHAGMLSVGLVTVACVVIAVGLVRGASQMPPDALRPVTLVAVVAGALVILAASWLYRYQVKPTEANAAANETSPVSVAPGRTIGMLNAAAGAFVIIAALGSPFIAGQVNGNGGSTQAQLAQSFAQAGPTDAASTVGAPGSSGSAATATPIVDPTATLTPTATLLDNSTPLPSLTPTQSETPIILSTPIVYISTYAFSTPTSCTVIAKTRAYLRGDPSEKIAAISTIIAGSLLNVTGRTSNKQWWRVVNTQGPVSIEGWVRADVVTADAACTDQAVPSVDGTVTPSRTPTGGNSSAGAETTAGTTNSSSGGTTVTATLLVAPGNCALLTTMSASLRADPSRVHAPIAQIPERTALSPSRRTADGQWWHVTYNNQDGWVGAGTVLASVDCRTVPTVLPTQQ